MIEQQQQLLQLENIVSAESVPVGHKGMVYVYARVLCI